MYRHIKRMFKKDFFRGDFTLMAGCQSVAMVFVAFTVRHSQFTALDCIWYVLVLPMYFYWLGAVRGFEIHHKKLIRVLRETPESVNRCIIYDEEIE